MNAVGASDARKNAATRLTDPPNQRLDQPRALPPSSAKRPRGASSMLLQEENQKLQIAGRDVYDDEDLPPKEWEGPSSGCVGV